MHIGHRYPKPQKGCWRSDTGLDYFLAVTVGAGDDFLHTESDVQTLPATDGPAKTATCIISPSSAELLYEDCGSGATEKATSSPTDPNPEMVELQYEDSGFRATENATSLPADPNPENGEVSSATRGWRSGVVGGVVSSLLLALAVSETSNQLFKIVIIRTQCATTDANILMLVE